MAWRDKLKELIDDEAKAFREYSEMAVEAEREGFRTVASIFRSIASQERDHRDSLTSLQEAYGTKDIPAGGYTKDFELSPGDRIRVTIPTPSGTFPAGWAEGQVISANHYGARDGWYIEFYKDNVSPGWQTGYGYWKQGEDGGTVEKMGERRFPRTYGDWVNLAEDIKEKDPSLATPVNEALDNIMNERTFADQYKRWLVEKAGELSIT